MRVRASKSPKNKKRPKYGWVGQSKKVPTENPLFYRRTGRPSSGFSMKRVSSLARVLSCMRMGTGMRAPLRMDRGMGLGAIISKTLR